MAPRRSEFTARSMPGNGWMAEHGDKLAEAGRVFELGRGLIGDGCLAQDLVEKPAKLAAELRPPPPMAASPKNVGYRNFPNKLPDGAKPPALGTFARGLGALGAVGGLMQTAEGLGEVYKGNRLDGGLKVLEGGTGLLGGGLTAAGVETGVPAIAGAGMVLEGVGDAYRGHRDGKPVQRGLGAIKGLAGLGVLGGLAIGSAPVALTGGILYALASAYQNREAIMGRMSQAGELGRGLLGR